MESAKDIPESWRPNAAALGFVGDEASGWVRSLRGRDIRFRLLRTLDDLAHAERLQKDVFGVSERDLIPANELIVIEETGGAVIGAFAAEHTDQAAAVLVGRGGFVGRPRIVSDFLAVRPEARNLGLAAELKRLQAAVALQRGFEEIVWTVDPLRAANARLNFGKLGAVATRYEIDRYGSTFAPGLYGGMPSDRLHVTWRITTLAVVQRLLGRGEAIAAETAPLPAYRSGTSERTARVDIPADIDALLADDLAAALDWRMRIREALLGAFGEGFVITGFQSAEPDQAPALVLERRQSSET